MRPSSTNGTSSRAGFFSDNEQNIKKIYGNLDLVKVVFPRFQEMGIIGNL